MKLKLYGRQGVGEYWIVDPYEETVDVWRFGEDAPEAEQSTDRLPVRLEDRGVGEIDLHDLFQRD